MKVARFMSICGSFISIAFVVVKLKVSKVFCIDSASNEMASFWFFGPLLPQTLFSLAEILTRGCQSPIRQTECLKNPSKF